VKLTKTLDLLARPRGFEPLTFSIECEGLGIRMTSFYIVLFICNSYFTTRLGKWLKDSLTYSSKLVTRLVRKGDKFLSQFCLWFRVHFLKKIRNRFNNVKVKLKLIIHRSIVVNPMRISTKI